MFHALMLNVVWSFIAQVSVFFLGRDYCLQSLFINGFVVIGFVGCLCHCTPSNLLRGKYDLSRCNIINVSEDWLHEQQIHQFYCKTFIF